MLEIEVKPHLFDRARKLVISPEVITYDDSDWRDIPSSMFGKHEVEGLRFGMEPIKGYAFTIRRRYCVDIMGLNDRMIKIRFTSLYGIRVKQLHEKYISILTAFFDTHQEDIINRYIESFNENGFVKILETTFKTDVVVLNGYDISYEELGYREYTGYFALFSKTNPKIYKSYSYLKDWNSAVVYSISKQLLADRGCNLPFAL